MIRLEVRQTAVTQDQRGENIEVQHNGPWTLEAAIDLCRRVDRLINSQGQTGGEGDGGG